MTLQQYEQELLKYTNTQLEAIPGLIILGKSTNKVPIISFFVTGISSFDLSQFLDSCGIATRSGKMCCHLLFESEFAKSLGVDSALRISLSFYNTKAEVDSTISALKTAITTLNLDNKTLITPD